MNIMGTTMAAVREDVGREDEACEAVAGAVGWVVDVIVVVVGAVGVVEEERGSIVNGGGVETEYWPWSLMTEGMSLEARMDVVAVMIGPGTRLETWGGGDGVVCMLAPSRTGVSGSLMERGIESVVMVVEGIASRLPNCRIMSVIDNP